MKAHLLSDSKLTMSIDSNDKILRHNQIETNIVTVGDHDNQDTNDTLLDKSHTDGVKETKNTKKNRFSVIF